MDLKYIDLMYIAIIVIGVLLPLLPAYILFKKLSASATVRGPWNGLIINLGGAMAAYFVILALILGFFHTYGNPYRLSYNNLKAASEGGVKVYTIKGIISTDDMSAFEGEKLKDFEIIVIPPTSYISRGGSFETKTSVGTKQDGKTLDFPNISVRHPNYSGEDIDLDDNKLIDLNNESREIILKSPIKLRKNTVRYGAEGTQRPEEVTE